MNLRLGEEEVVEHMENCITTLGILFDLSDSRTQ